MMSSIQSVAGHPVAAPDSNPTHHGVFPSATISSDRAIRSSNVAGTSYPAASKSSFGYQIIDFRLTLVGTPQCSPSNSTSDIRYSPTVSSIAATSIPMSSSETIVPAAASVATVPGCGTSATSSVPPSALIGNCSSKSAEASISTV